MKIMDPIEPWMEEEMQAWVDSCRMVTDGYRETEFSKWIDELSIENPEQAWRLRGIDSFEIKTNLLPQNETKLTISLHIDLASNESKEPIYVKFEHEETLQTYVISNLTTRQIAKILIAKCLNQRKGP